MEGKRISVEEVKQAMAAAQYSGSLPPASTAAEGTAGTLITGTDRVMVPLVTQPQIDQRRATEWAQRLAQGRSSTASVGRPKQARERPFQEFKLVAFYDPDKAHCQVVGTAGDHTVAGRLMCREARRLRLAQATVKYAVSDGAEWIAHQYQRQLPMLDVHILGYYPLREHVVRASYGLYGEGTKKAEQWREEMMGWVREQGSLVLLDRLGAYLRRHRTGPSMRPWSRCGITSASGWP